MSVQFQKAELNSGHVLVSFASASGGGKTFSAMRLAAGLSDGKRFAVIDTEAGRAKHYAGKFDFDHADLEPPFTPEKYSQAVEAAERAGYPVIVIDSMSHEWDGEGGLLEIVEGSNAKGPGAWAMPKKRHKKMVNKFLQTRAHLIFCLRAEEKIDLSDKDDRGKVIVKSQGWIPICEKRFMYEMTMSFTFRPDAPGMIDLALPHKLQDQHRLAFPPGAFVTETGGDTLRRWSIGEAIEEPDTPLWNKARTIAQEGRDKLLQYWQNVATDDEKKRLLPISHELKNISATADSNNAVIDRMANQKGQQ